MNLERFQLTVRGKMALLEMARPDALNVIDETALLELEGILAIIQKQGIKAVVLTGQGRAFAAGADVAAMAKHNARAAQTFSEQGNGIFQQIEDHPTVFLAAINGYALGGGCELALACDLRFASSKALFGLPEVNVGLIPGFGGTQRLPRIIGPSRATEWILTGSRFSAEEALAVGLVSRVIEPDQLLAEAIACAEEIAKKSAPILALAKQAIKISIGIRPEQGLQEAELFGKCFSTHDGPEGIEAFLQKRNPKFLDR